MKQPRSFQHVMFAFLMFSLASAGFCIEEAKSTWASSPVRIDGIKTEWNSSILNTYKKTMVDYAFMNNGEHLFILFIFNDPEYLSSIDFTGMTIWFNRQKKKKKKCGLKFMKKQITADEYIAILEGQTGTVPEERKNKIRQNPNYIVFSHLVVTEEGDEYSEGGDRKIMKGVHFREGRLQNSVLYEFMVPLQEMSELAANISAEPGNSLNVGFEWGGATKEIKKAIASQLAASDSKARAGRATSLTGERGRESSSDTPSLARIRKRLPKKYDFWVEVTLAQKQDSALE